jgi:very-long-chain (3R)-3-hydroxyacyl-CoA dehydratase
VGATQLHAALGSLTKWTVTLSLLSFTVPSPKALSRLFLVWGVCDRFNASQDSTAYTTMLLAWSAMEVCRYAYYLQPRMRWVRYNVRYVADPIAVASEAWCIFRALPEAAEEGGGWYYWCLVVALAGYVPGRWFLRWGERKG